MKLLSLAQKKLGFTLLELLVVISIIGILIAIGVASFSTAQRQGRDAHRRADVKAMQNALEQFYATNNNYTSACSGSGTTTIAITVGGQTSRFSDPTTQNYTCVTNATDYCVCAQLSAGVTTGNRASTCTSATDTLGTSGNFFCVRNLQ